MRKRFMSAFLALCMVLTLLPGTAFAAETVDSGSCGSNLTWTLNSNGVLLIEGTGQMYDYNYNSYHKDNIPEGLKGDDIWTPDDNWYYHMTSPWFSYRNQIKRIEIGDGVTNIGMNAFCACENLSSINLPNSLSSIKKFAFWGCSHAYISIPDGTTRIGDRAFMDCKNLVNVDIADSVTTIEYGAFLRCSSLSNVDFPASLITVGEAAFYDTGLVTVSIPDSVIAIGTDAFANCLNLKEVTIPNSITTIGQGVFSDCPQLTDVHIPKSVSTIGFGAFSNSGLVEINIPDGVVSIENGAFRDCLGLNHVNIPNSITNIGFGAFSGTNLSYVAIPDSITDFGEGPFGNCSSLSAVQVDANNPAYKSVDGILFDKTGDTLIQYPAGKSGREYTVPDSVSQIEGYSFEGCHNLTAITVPGSVSRIEDFAFTNCLNLTSLVLQEGVIFCESSAFWKCVNLESLTIPRSVTGGLSHNGSFEECDKLTIYCYKGSYAHRFAQSENISFVLLDDDPDEPDIPAPSIQSLTLTRNGTTSDLLTQSTEFEQGSTDTAAVSVEVDWDTGKTGRAFLMQDRDTYIELPASFTPGAVFAPDAPVYVIATNTAADILLDWKETMLQIVQSQPDTPQISVSPETLNLSVGETGDVTVTTTPEGAQYNLTSSDPEVVSVYGNTLTAHKLGRAEITAALADHPDVTAVCSVAVKDGYDDLMCAIAASQLSYEDELIRYGFGATVETFADAAIGPDRTLWNWAVWDAPLSDFYKDVLGDWKIVNVTSTASGLFAVALDNAERKQRIIAFRGTESPEDVWADLEFAVLNKLPGQFVDAVDFYKKSIGDERQILLTGHSLGGAIACYISLLTGERAELFNGANGLIMEDAYFAGGEEIYRHFRGADRWNFTNHVTDSKNAANQFIQGTALLNEKITYPNADRLPVEIHVPAITATTGAVGKNSCHDLCSMLEYDRSTGRFWLTQSTPYRQTLPDVRQFEMTRVDALYFMRKVIDVYQQEPATFILEQIIFSVSGLQGFLEEHIGAYEKVFFAFGSSGNDTIATQKIIEQVFLFGGDGNDFLNGGCINDVLVGGLGVNSMDGGPMNDLYVITGTSDQYINDCSGVDDIYIPSGVRVRSYGNPTDKVDEYYVLTLTNGQRIMINKNRKQDFDNRFRVYSMDGTFCGSYRTIQEEPKAKIMTLTAEDKAVRTTGTLPITTLEFSGRGLMLEIQDDAENAVGTVNTASDSFPLYKPYGYFYYDGQAGTLRAHLFGGSGEVKVSSADPSTQTIACTSIFHNAEDDLPVKRFTARVELHSSESVLTPSCVAEEPAVPFKVMNGNGKTQVVPTKTEDLTGSESPDVPVPEQPSSGSGGWSTSTYVIAVEKPEHGKVTPNHTDAPSGSTVTLTVVPDSGYVLDTLTVTDSQGSEIKLTAQDGGKYTFTMPGRAVTVTAIFTPLLDNDKEPCDGGADCPSHGFTDLDTVGTWYHEAVDYVLKNNLMGGYGNGLFGPDDTLTRAQFAQILYNKEGRPVVDNWISFSDVADAAWYADAVSWAAECGIVSGYGGGRFGPDDNITREQLAVILWRYSASPAATNRELNFTDADEASGWALEALYWAVENGIINGKGGGILDTKGPATRAQVAQLMMNYLMR